MSNPIRLHFVLFLMLIPFLFGCASVSVNLNRFDPAPGQPSLKIDIRDKEKYFRHEDNKYRITAALFEYNNIIVLPLEIANKEKTDLQPAEYSVSLRDGRDLKTIKLLSRQELIIAKGRYEGHGGGGIQDQLIEITVQTLSGLVNAPTRELLLKVIDHAIDNYFDFRPIYAGENRTGILCFVVDFKLEYPLTLTVNLKDEKIDLRFLPAQKL